MMRVANLWAKQLIVGDRIVAVDLVDHWKYGPIKRFEVERTEENHAEEAARIKAAEQSEGQGE